MENTLNKVLTKIGEDYKEDIQYDSRFYLEISIAGEASQLGLKEVAAHYRNAFAIIPIKHPVGGMKVRVDGRTFVNYAQFESGVVVPHYMARQVDLPHRAYVARDDMICNFA